MEVEKHVITNEDKKHRRRKFKTKKQKRKERKNGEPKQDDRDLHPRKVTYDNVVKKNENFEQYYRLQKLFETEDEFQLFLQTLAEPLPTTFRISSFCRGQSQRMRDIIQSDYIKNCQLESHNDTNDDNDDRKQLDIRPIPWYPNRLAWQINLTKTEIRKSRSINLLHKFLICETETGNISRQEAVSMIPPLLLDIRPGQSVLDMCAAPGSKTAQIIEMLHQESGATFMVNDTCAPADNNVKYLDGLVVANDVDNRRCYMLAHQSNRLSSSCVVITNHDAANLPNFYKTNPQNGQKTLLKFDRVLADVLCSGDGTFRKNYDVWTKWSAGNANNLHNIQLKIAKRGLEMLAKNGVMAYSTCSLNPVENEAVIAALLNMANGSDGNCNHLELIDARKILPELKCYPGIDDWIVMDKDNNHIRSPKEVPEKFLPQIRRTHFPPSNAKQLNLHYCIRIMPHYQNTGGFFIALLRKNVDVFGWEADRQQQSEQSQRLGPTPAESMTTDDLDQPSGLEPEADNSNANTNDDRPKKDKKSKGGYQGFREEPFYFLDEQDHDWISLRSYFRFPTELQPNQLAHRCVQGKRRNIYFMTPKVANFVRENRDLKIISAGARVFNRTDVTHLCPYRITQEGIVSIFSYFAPKLNEYQPTGDVDLDRKTFKIIKVNRDIFIDLLKYQDVKIADITDSNTKELISKIPSGCFIMYVIIDQSSDGGDNGNDGGDEVKGDGRKDASASSFMLPMCVWRGKNQLRAYVAKMDRTHLLRLCGYEPMLMMTDSNKTNDHQLQTSKDQSLDNDDGNDNEINDDNNDGDDNDMITATAINKDGTNKRSLEDDNDDDGGGSCGSSGGNGTNNDHHQQQQQCKKINNDEEVIMSESLSATTTTKSMDDDNDGNDNGNNGGNEQNHSSIEKRIKIS